MELPSSHSIHIVLSIHPGTWSHREDSPGFLLDFASALIYPYTDDQVYGKWSSGVHNLSPEWNNFEEKSSTWKFESDLGARDKKEVLRSRWIKEIHFHLLFIISSHLSEVQKWINICSQSDDLKKRMFKDRNIYFHWYFIKITVCFSTCKKNKIKSNVTGKSKFTRSVGNTKTEREEFSIWLYLLRYQTFRKLVISKNRFPRMRIFHKSSQKITIMFNNMD